MDKIIYDLNDEPVGVLDGNTIYTFDGYPTAYLYNGRVVVGWNGIELCVFQHGEFLDRGERKIGSLTPIKFNPNSPPRRPLQKYHPDTKSLYPPANKSKPKNRVSDPQSLGQIIRSGAKGTLPPPSPKSLPNHPVQP